MLEESRKKGASIFVYLIFCLLIAIFVINFGPQGGQGGGCGASSSALTVNGEEVSNASFQIAFAANGGRGQSQKKQLALELLIRKEILAQEAESRGLRVTEEMVHEEIKKGRFFLGGQRSQIPGIFTEDGIWNQNAFRGWYSNLNVSRSSYVNEQQRGFLAAMMGQILAESVQVSRDEALQHYLFENNTVQYDVVAFRGDAYAKAMKLTDADVERFLASHGAEVEARYKSDERTYKGVKPQLQLRQIFIAKLEEAKPAAPTPPAPEAGSAAAPAAGSAAPAAGSAAAPAPAAPKTEPAKVADKKPVGMKIEEAKAKLEAARTAIAAGKQKFADAAKQLNTDEAAKANGGELGWRTADSAMLGDKAVTDAVKDLKAGEMTPVITTDKGAYLVIAEARREGDLTFDQVKHELAKQLALDVWGKEAAKRAALAALETARGGTGKNLDQMFDKEAPKTPGFNFEDLMNDPNMSPEDKQKLIEMMMRQQGQKSGALVIESKDVPASWRAQAGGAGGSATGVMTPVPPAGSAAAPTNPAAGSPAPTKPAAGSPAPTKPAAGSAAPTAAAGSAAPTATPAAGSAAPAAGAAPTGAAAPTATPPASTEVVATTEQLPAMGTVEKPFVARFGPAPRSTTMSGIGGSKEAAAALFDELTPGMLAKKVYEAEGGYVVMQLITRNQPKVEDFDKDAARLVDELRQSRAQEFLTTWMKDRCEKLAKDGKITPNQGLLQETDDQGKPVPTTYKPCVSFQQR